MTFQTVWETLDFSVQDAFPELETVNSAAEVSKRLFGIKTMTHKLGMELDGINALRAFFDGNPSGMVQWGTKARGQRFCAAPAHRKTFARMVDKLGIDLAVALTENRDFQDIATGFEFALNDKKVWLHFKANILDNLHLFPRGHTHAVMIHDYLDGRMKIADIVANPRTRAAEIPLGMPEIDIIVEEDFQVFIPHVQSDLRRIGNAQNHCVGTRQMGYGDRIRRGDIWIFAVYKKTLADGVCVEVDAGNGEILQAQGRLRRAPTRDESAVILYAIEMLQNGEDSE